MKNTIKIMLFTLLLGACLFFSYEALKLKDTNGNPGSSIEILKKTDKDLVDVFFVGSSHVYCGIQPSALWRKKGIAAFDLSISGMDKESAYYTTKYEVSKFRPKVVVVDTFALTYTGYAVEGNLHRNMLQLPTSVESVSLVRTIPATKREKLDYVLRVPYIHARYKELTRADFCNDSRETNSKGENVTFDNAGWLGDILPEAPDEVEELSAENKDWLDRFMALSKEEGFELVFVRLPYTSIPEHQKIYNGAAEYVHALGYDFIDFNKDVSIIDFSISEFCDPTHLNTRGGIKVSEWLANYLSDKYQLEDHRKDVRYISWDKNAQYSYLAQEMLEIKNSSIIDAPEEFLSKIQGYDGLVNIIVSMNPDGDYEADVLKCLETLGISYEEAITSGVWINKSMQSEKIATLYGEKTVYYDLEKFATMKVTVNEDSSLNLKIAMDELGIVPNGLSVFVYDTINHCVAVTKHIQ